MTAESGETKGFLKDRLVDKSDSFDCIICFNVAKNPLECLGCGQKKLYKKLSSFSQNMNEKMIKHRNKTNNFFQQIKEQLKYNDNNKNIYSYQGQQLNINYLSIQEFNQTYCRNCQESWKSELGSYQCLKCDSQKMNQLNQHLMEVYQILKYKCTCNNIFTLQEMPKHEEYCSLPNCKYFAYCNLKVSPQFKKQQVCSSTCQILELTQQNIKDQNKLYKLIMDVLKSGGQTNGLKRSSSKQDNSSIAPNIPIVPFIQIKNSFPNQNSNQVQFKWDKIIKGDNIHITSDGTKAQLKESIYVFKSVIADIPFEKGQHYFEIILDAITENELKIGVVTNNTFNKNTAFCDQEIGFGYYTIGKLRNGSNAHGSDYGQKFKNSGTCGVYLDMSKGLLAFSYNGVCFGVAFRSSALKQSPIYASVSLLHCAGFTLRSGLNIPAWANDLN